MKETSRWTIFIFGLLAFLLGAVGLKSPGTLLKLMNFKTAVDAEQSTADYTNVFVRTSSMASFNMGIYYMLAAWTNTRSFFYWTVPFRVVTFTVFTTIALKGLAPINFVLVALWELVGAVLTGLALWREDQRSDAGR